MCRLLFFVWRVLNNSLCLRKWRQKCFANKRVSLCVYGGGCCCVSEGVFGRFNFVWRPVLTSLTKLVSLHVVLFGVHRKWCEQRRSQKYLQNNGVCVRQCFICV